MEDAVYHQEALLEESHWWFVGRRALFRREIARLGIAKSAAILDVGSGTGANLRLLRDLGYANVTGIDASPIAQQHCRDKGLGEILLGDIRKLPFEDSSFDFIMATDVIEHIDEDQAALNELCRVLKEGGRILITVPTFMSLWGFQDIVSQHKRRYRVKDLLNKVSTANLREITHYHFNFFLFGPIYLARKILAWTNPNIRSENQINNRFVNSVLVRVFALDTSLARYVRPPFGVSAMILAQRPAVLRS